jgi:DNA-binding CsgD family transcriptional regulator
MQQALDRVVDGRDTFVTGIIRSRLSHLTLLDGQIDRAVALQRENLAARWSRGDRFGIAESLCLLAWAASAAGAAEQAAVWLGAADNLWHMTGGTLPHQYAPDQAHAQSTARAALGDAAFDAAFARGRAQALDSVVSRALVARPLTQAQATSNVEPAEVEKPLSPRERAVVILVAQGMSNRAIAGSLVISERTAETHVKHIRQKLGCSSRAEIALWAERAGLLVSDS